MGVSIEMCEQRVAAAQAELAAAEDALAHKQMVDILEIAFWGVHTSDAHQLAKIGATALLAKAREEQR
jgi:hypothetical protein